MSTRFIFVERNPFDSRSLRIGENFGVLNRRDVDLPSAPKRERESSTLPERPPPLSVAYGGGAGVLLKSKQSDISSAAASRLLRGFRPKIVSQALTKLT